MTVSSMWFLQKAQTALVICPTDDFPLEQSCDDSLHSAFDQVIGIDGDQVRPEATRTYPCSVLLNDRLYWVSRDTGTEDEQTQLLMSESCREIIFQVAQYNSMAGHMRYDKTLERVMA